jgi:hypothetical protein
VDGGERTTTDFPQFNGVNSTQGKGAWVATPEQVSVWVGLDVGKESHFADVLDNDGERLFARAIGNDQADIDALLDRASKHGVPGLVIDQPGSIAQLVLAVAARRGTPVAYVPGLVMRRAADLYPGEARPTGATPTSSPILPAPGGSRSTGWMPPPTSCSRSCASSTASTPTSRLTRPGSRTGSATR